MASLLAASPVTAGGAGWLDRSFGTNGTTLPGPDGSGRILQVGQLDDGRDQAPVILQRRGG